MKRIIKASLVLLLVAALGIFVVFWNFNRAAFPLKKLDLLKVGMTSNEVELILGSPCSHWIRTNSVGEVYFEWTYARRLSWPIVHVYFDSGGMLERFAYDH